MPRVKKQEGITVNCAVNSNSIYSIIDKVNTIMPTWRYKDFPWKDMEKLVKEIGSVIEIECKEGSDYDSKIYTIIKLVDHNIYLKAEGHYSSYDNSNYSGDWEQVIPVEVTKIEYVPA